ncbi:MAG: DNA-3-methyladenine glycosylase 2 family protein [SAR202 cluster bacterium]|nr:DNA-3-methyladenine glycosylase 2 family protein [SAR202 cluster bacterium]
MNSIKIAARQPIDIEQTLQSGQVFRWNKIGEWYYLVINHNLVSIKQESLEDILVRSETLSGLDLETAVNDYFRLDDDIEYIYKSICTDKHIRSAIQSYRGLRIVRQDPWECLVSFICSANSNIPRISSNMTNLAAAYGNKLHLDEHSNYSFPSPHQIFQAGEQQLRELKLGFRARYVAAAAKFVLYGECDLDSLKKLSYEESKQTLTLISGVGQKVADCVLLFSLEKLQACPVDRWVRRAMEGWYSIEPNLSYEEISSWAINRWGPFTGYAQQYLFQQKRLEVSN